MNVASVTTPKWTIGIRPTGEELAAASQGPELSLALLGVPQGFTPIEVEGWLADLKGVATETSRADSRSRAIPALLHHSLTGLLFSQSELWGHAAEPTPCTLAFANPPEGPAFGWVGEARVTIELDGRPLDPQWIRVRDDEGREARAIAFGAGHRVRVIVEWPIQPSAGPSAAIEATWNAPPAVVAHAPATLAAPSVPVLDVPRVSAPPPRESSVAIPQLVRRVAPAEDAAEPTPLSNELDAALFRALPMEQPGLAPPPGDPATAQGIQMVPPADLLSPEVSGEMRDAPGEETLFEHESAHRPHPVQRWLSKLVPWRKKAPEPREDDLRNDEDFIAPTFADPPAPSPAAEAIASLPSSEQTAFELAAEIGRQGMPSWKRDPDAPESDIPTHLPSDVSTLPKLSPKVPSPTSRELGVTHEPVGADTGFAIPRLPEWLSSSGAQDKPAAEIRPLPHVVAPAPPAAPPVERPSAPPIAAMAPPSVPAPPPVAHVAPPAPVVPRPAAAPALPPTLAPAPPARVVTPPPARPVFAPAPRPAAAPVAHPRVPVLDPGPLSGPAPPLELEPTGAVITPVPVITARTPNATEPTERIDAVAPIAAARPAPADDDPFVRPDLGSPRGPRPARLRPTWPAAEELDRARPSLVRRYWPWAAGVVVLVGTVVMLANSGPHQRSPLARVLGAIGMGGATFDVVINSQPPGAWIAVDGKDAAHRTPATLSLPPGEHQVTLSLPDLGAMNVPVRGVKGDRLTIDPSLAGSLEVYATDASVPISVRLDGKPIGYAPAQIPDVPPGLHELTFTGPNMPAWAQTVQVGVRQAAQVIARPMTSPATGVIQVQAMLADEEGSSPLTGAAVYVDGEPRGATPVAVEVARGPHSLRVQWRGLTAPVQVIDLPGGNQRFASFTFGLDDNGPRLALLAPQRSIPVDQAAVVSASITGLSTNDIREAWLHVRSGEGLWRRYEMTTLKGTEGVVLVAVFPPTSFDSDGRTKWYVSATTLQGDEYYSEMQAAQSTRTARPASAAGTAP